MTDSKPLCVICGDPFVPKTKWQSKKTTCSPGCAKALDAKAAYRFQTKNVKKSKKYE